MTDIDFGLDHKIRHPPCLCRQCGACLDAANGPVAKVTPGDLSVCVYCGTLSVFGEDSRLREPSEAETASIMASADLRAVIDKIRSRPFPAPAYTKQ